MANKTQIIDISESTTNNIINEFVQSSEALLAMAQTMPAMQRSSVSWHLKITENMANHLIHMRHVVSHVNIHSLQEAIADTIECVAKNQND